MTENMKKELINFLLVAYDDCKQPEQVLERTHEISDMIAKIASYVYEDARKKNYSNHKVNGHFNDM